MRSLGHGQALDDLAKQAKTGRDDNGPPSMAELGEQAGEQNAITVKAADSSKRFNMGEQCIRMTLPAQIRAPAVGYVGAPVAGDHFVWSRCDDQAVGIRDEAAAPVISTA